MISGHTPTIVLTQLLKKVALLSVVVTVALHVSAVKKSSLDIFIGNPDFVFQRTEVGIPNILQPRKATCLADPGFNVCFGFVLCVNDAAQVREMGDFFYRFYAQCD